MPDAAAQYKNSLASIAIPDPYRERTLKAIADGLLTGPQLKVLFFYWKQALAKKHCGEKVLRRLTGHNAHAPLKKFRQLDLIYPRSLGNNLPLGEPDDLEAEGVKTPLPEPAAPPPTSYEEAGNSASLTAYKDEEVRSLEDLVRVCKIDLSVWHVEKYICNVWHQGAKVRRGTTEEMVTTPLYQIKAWLVRRVGRQIVTDIPALTPARFTVTPIMAPPIPRTPLRSALIVADPHFGFLRDTHTGALTPFHDRQAVDAVLQLATLLQPKTILCLGDWLDLPEFSDKFLKSPEFYFTLQPALYEGGWVMAQLRARCPKARIVLLAGNHDVRIQKSLFAHLLHLHGIRPANAAPDAPAITSLTNLLGLQHLKIECEESYPAGKVWLNRRLEFRHGEEVGAKPGSSVGKTLAKGGAHSEGYGHTHRLESAFRTSFEYDGPVSYSAHSFGTLARLDGPIPAFSAERDWQNGTGVIWYDDDHHQTDLLHIQQGVLIWHGQVIQGKDYAKILSKDTGWTY